jgi:protoheme IX farnesyltransferase
MAPESISALEVAGTKARNHACSTTLVDYWTLTKPEVNFLIGMATAAGFCLALPAQSHPFPLVLLVHTLLGTVLVGGGAGVLNQFIERGFDAQMRRTAGRPLAAARVRPWDALCFGISLSSAGATYLAIVVNTFASLLAVLTLLSYLFIYTPLKRITPLCTLVGAVSGAMPTLIGWSAGSGRLDLKAWALYAVLFLWQFPHFMAIAWMYREDYGRAGFIVLPSPGNRDHFMTWMVALPALVLVPLSLVLMSLNHAGSWYMLAALLLDFWFCCHVGRVVLHRTNALARRLLFASVIYLPVLLILLVARAFQ